MSPDEAAAPPAFLAGGGEMGALMRSHDWASSPLGGPGTWPQSLRTVVDLMLGSRHPMFVAWGPELAFLYNDGYAPIFGAKHPQALGLPFRQVWSEIWEDIRPLIERALAGEATWSEDLHLVMLRNGYPEDTWYTFSYSPARDEAGRVAGMFCACTETTAKVLGERRLAFQLGLEERLRGLPEPEAIAAATVEALGEHLGAPRIGFAAVEQGGSPAGTDRLTAMGGADCALEELGTAAAAELRAGRVVLLTGAAQDPGTAPRRAARARALASAPASLCR